MASTTSKYQEILEKLAKNKTTTISNTTTTSTRAKNKSSSEPTKSAANNSSTTATATRAKNKSSSEPTKSAANNSSTTATTTTAKNGTFQKRTGTTYQDIVEKLAKNKLTTASTTTAKNDTVGKLTNNKTYTQGSAYGQALENYRSSDPTTGSISRRLTNNLVTKYNNELAKRQKEQQEKENELEEQRKALASKTRIGITQNLHAAIDNSSYSPQKNFQTITGKQQPVIMDETEYNDYLNKIYGGGAYQGIEKATQQAIEKQEEKRTQAIQNYLKENDFGFPKMAKAWDNTSYDPSNAFEKITGEQQPILLDEDEYNDYLNKLNGGGAYQGYEKAIEALQKAQTQKNQDTVNGYTSSEAAYEDQLNKINGGGAYRGMAGIEEAYQQALQEKTQEKYNKLASGYLGDETTDGWSGEDQQNRARLIIGDRESGAFDAYGLSGNNLRTASTNAIQARMAEIETQLQNLDKVDEAYHDEQDRAARTRYLFNDGLDVGYGKDAVFGAKSRKAVIGDEEYEGYNEYICQEAAYNFIHGDGAFEAWLDTNPSDDEVAAVEKQMDSVWEALEEGDEKKLYTAMWGQEFQNLSTGNKTKKELEQEQQRLQSELTTRQQTAEAEQNAAGLQDVSGEYNEELAKESGIYFPTTYQQLMGYQTEPVYGGEEIDRQYYLANHPWQDGDYTVDTAATVKKEYFLTDEQLETFNKFYNSGDKESAKAYIDGLSGFLQQMKAEYESADITEFTKKYGLTGSLVSLASNVTGGVEGSLGTIAALFGDEEAADPNSDYFRDTRLTQAIRSERGNQWASTMQDWYEAMGGEGSFGEDAGRFLYNTAMSINDNLTAMGVSMVAGGPATTMGEAMVQLIMSMSAASSQMVENLENNKQPVESALGAIASGVIEAVTEKYSIENLMSDPTSAGKYLLKNFIAESSEEGASDVLNYVYDEVSSFVAGHRSELEKEIDEKAAQYETDGMQKDAAKQKATKEVLLSRVEEMGLDMLAGGLSGLTMSGGRYAGISAENVYNDFKTAKAVKESDGIAAIVTPASGIKGSDAFNEWMAQMKEKVDNDEEITLPEARKTVKLIRKESSGIAENVAKEAMTTYVREQIESKIQEGKAYAENIVQRAAEAVTELATNDNPKLTADQEEAYKYVQEAREVMNEMLSGEHDEGVAKAQAEATAPLSKIEHTIEQALSPESSKIAESAVEEARVATEEEKQEATGTSTGAATEVIVDGEYTQVTRYTGDGNVTVRSSDGTTRTVTTAEVTATNETMGAVISYIENNQGIVSERFGTELIQVAGTGAISDAQTFLTDAYKVRAAAFTGSKVPTNVSISTNAVEFLYTASQEDAKAADVERIRKAATYTSSPTITIETADGQTVSATDTEAFRNATEGLSNQQRAEVQYLADVFGKMGVNANFVRGENTRIYGSYQNNTVTLNLDGANANGTAHSLVIAAGHELTHYLEAHSTEGYNDLRNFVLSSLRKSGVDVNRRIQQVMDNYNRTVGNSEPMTMNGAIAEIVADASDQILLNENLVRQLSEDHPSLYNRIKTKVEDFLKRFREATTGAKSSASQYSREMESVADELARVWGVALEETQRASRAEASRSAEVTMAERGTVNAEAEVEAEEGGAVQFSIQAAEEMTSDELSEAMVEAAKVGDIDTLQQLRIEKFGRGMLTETDLAMTAEEMDDAYDEAIADGNWDRANALIRYKLMQDESTILMDAPEFYYGKTNHEIAKLIKTANEEAVLYAAQRMAKLVKPNAVLVPMPNHLGQSGEMLVLANAISEITGAPVVEALGGEERPSSYETKKKGKRLTAADLKMYQIAEIPEGKTPVVIDNVVSSGVTAQAARDVLGKGTETLAFALGMGRGAKNIYRVPGLKQAHVTYDDNKTYIPLSQRGNMASSDVRYSLAGPTAEVYGEDVRRAVEMHEHGASDEEIFDATGAIAGYRGRYWKVVDNSNMHLKDDFKPWKQGTYRLGDVYEAEELYKAYPDAADITLTMERLEDASGYYDRKNGIHLSVYDNHSVEDAEYTLQHELQHWIQQKENTDNGASSAWWRYAYAAMESIFTEYSEPIYQKYTELAHTEKPAAEVQRKQLLKKNGEVRKNVSDTVRKVLESISLEERKELAVNDNNRWELVRKYRPLWESSANRLYQNTVGEIEARAASREGEEQFQQIDYTDAVTTKDVYDEEQKSFKFDRGYEERVSAARENANGAIAQEESEDTKYSIMDSSDNVSEYLDNLTEDQLTTDLEKKLFRSYKEKLEAVQATRRRMELMRADLATSTGDRARALRINLQTEENKLTRQTNELNEITSAEGYMAIMARGQRVVDQFLTGKTREEVQNTTRALKSKIESMAAQLKELRNTAEKLSQDTATAEAMKYFSKTKLAESARSLKKTFGSTIKSEELQTALAKLTLEMATHDDRFSEDVTELATDIVEQIRGEADPELASRRDILRGTYTLNAGQWGELMNAYDNAKNLRRALAGTGLEFKKAKYDSQATMDLKWGQLAELMGNSLDWDVSEGDQALTLIDLALKLKDEAEGGLVKQFGRDAIITDVSYEILDKIVLMVPTVAGDSEARQKIRKALSAIKGDKVGGDIDAMMEQAESLLDTMTEVTKGASQTASAASIQARNASKAVAYYDALSKAYDTEAEIQKMEALRQQLESDAAKKVVEANEKWQKTLEEDRTIRELNNEIKRRRNQVTNAFKRYNNLLVKETDTKNIPEQYKSLVREALRPILEHDAIARTKITGLLNAQIKDDMKYYEAWKKSFGTGVNLDMLQNLDGSVDEDLVEQVEMALYRIQKGVNEYGKGGRGRTAAELQTNYDALEDIRAGLDVVNSVVTSARTAWIDGKRVELSDLAEAVKADAEKQGIHMERAGAIGTAFNAAARSVGWGNLTPTYFFKNLNNEGMNQLWQEMENGENNYGLLLAKMQQRVNEIAEKYGYSTWDLDKTYSVQLESGKTVNLTVEQMMTLLASWKREMASANPEESTHLLKGGFVYEERHKRGKYSPVLKPHQVTGNDIQLVQSILTEDQINYMDEIVGVLSTDMADIGNEASMKMYGIKKYLESYYFPFHSWKGQLNKASNAGGTMNPTSQNRAAKQGFTHRRTQYANNALMLDDFTTTAMEHINNMLVYNTMAPAVENMNRVLNYRTTESASGNENELTNGTKRNIETVLTERYGKNAVDYLRTFMKDVNGGFQQDSRKTLSERLLSIFKKNAVAGSLSVTAQQPLSYIRAGNMISPKYLVEALNPSTWKGSYQEMMEHSGVAVIKDMGRFDMNFGRGGQEYLTPSRKQGTIQSAYETISEKSTILPELADRMTWTRMWCAVKLEQAAQNPNMDTKSDEFLDMCGERFNDIMRRTQVYDSALVKSANMRSDKYTMKAATSFMAEPTLSANLLMDAWQNRNTEGGKAALVVAGATFAVSAALQAAVKGIMTAGRSPDDKKTLEENFLYRFVPNLISESNPLALIPGYSILIDELSGSDVNDNAYGIIKTMTQAAITKPAGILSGTEGASKGAYRDIEDTAAQLAQIFTGVPARNIMRDMRAVYTWFSGSYSDRPTSGAVIREQTKQAFLTEDLAGMLNTWLQAAGMGYSTSAASQYDRIAEAYKAGNTDAAHQMLEYMQQGKGYDADKIRSALSSRLKDDENAEDYLADAWEAMKAYNTERSETAEEYAASYQAEHEDATEGDVYWATKKYEQKLETGTTAGWSKYDNLKEAISANKASDIGAAVEELIAYGTKESSIVSQITSMYKEEYLSLQNGSKEKVTMKDALTKAYKAAGLSEEKAVKKINDWEGSTEGGTTTAEVQGTTGKKDNSKPATVAQEAEEKYKELVEAIEKNKASTINEAVNTLVKQGTDQAVIREEVETLYKDQYTDLASGSLEKVTMKDALTKVYKAAGLTATEAGEKINNWNKEHPAEENTTCTWAEARERYISGSMSKEEAMKAYQTNYPKASEDDAWFAIDKAEYQKNNGVAPYGDYYRMHDAITDGTTEEVTSAVNLLMSHGKKKNGVKASIEVKYGDGVYKNLPSGEKEKAKEGITAAMKAAGYTNKQINNLIKKLNK